MAHGFRRYAGAKRHNSGIPGISAGEKLIDQTTPTSGNRWRRHADWQVCAPVVTAVTLKVALAFSQILCIKIYQWSFNMRHS